MKLHVLVYLQSSKISKLKDNVVTVDGHIHKNEDQQRSVPSYPRDCDTFI